MQKVCIYSWHPPKKFGKDRIGKLRELHGDTAEIVFERLIPIEGTAQHVLMRYAALILEKQEAGFKCYLEIDKALAKKLVSKGISFGVIDKPQHIPSGHKITFTYYDSHAPLAVSDRVIATFTRKRMPESGGFINRNGRGSKAKH